MEVVKVSTTLSKWGNSQGVRLPKSILDAASIGEGEDVEISADKTGIKIRKAVKIETLDDLFKDYHGDYKCEEIDTGEPVGNEVW
jgi:antitoxin MazE